MLLELSKQQTKYKDLNSFIDIAREQLLPIVELALDERSPRRWYSALMDYGSYLKKQISNPSRRSAHHAVQSRFEGSNRQLRGKLLKFFAARHTSTLRDLCRAFARERRLARALGELIAEGFLKKDKPHRVRLV